MANVPAPLADEIADVVAIISAGLDVAGIGKAVVGAFLQQRVEAIREQLIEDAKRGKIGAIDLYDNPNVPGYIFRLLAAIRQGTRAKNIRLLARYLFGKARMDYDACVEDAAIIESLTDAEMRCLVIYKRALDSAQLLLRPDDEAPDGVDPMRYTVKGIDRMGYFSTHTAFTDAAGMLQRWGLVRNSMTFDSHGPEPTPKLLSFMDRLDLDGIINL